jgi:hypothetical protein
MIFIIHVHNHIHSHIHIHNHTTIGDSVMNVVHLFIFYMGLILLYHATTRIK